MLSIVVTYYQDSGGVHGFYENESYNIYMNTGEKLSFKSLFKENKDYKSIIENNIREQIKKLSKDKDLAGVYEFKGINENQKFYIQDNNLVVYFDLYEIAPYAAGIPEFNINISDISHIINEEYIDIFK